MLLALCVQDTSRACPSCRAHLLQELKLAAPKQQRWILLFQDANSLKQLQTALVWKMQVLHMVFIRHYSRVIAVSTWPLLLYMALEAELFPGSLRTRGLKLSSLMMVREQKGAEVFQGTATELQPGSENGEQSKVSFVPVLGSKQQPGSFEQRVYEAAVVSEYCYDGTGCYDAILNNEDCKMGLLES
ncbi:uncharacterized protein LOC112550808 isoform X2 [Alligator sinensis]|uniref:Uncharacterized protein LOC112550808 isoform X2 n=1 Tax=Alligator sinensis TaxID=38654 RepID=A0A3Q0GZQ4_ALLSI|nr:uncharacterized protein LOC112550808 isoform X2 [Alligator sinensis]